ncbi:hypothetical protein RhiJN_13180 [Ceratobasidium sp. AG-Ba]|nr:hypothetical protein RhiJN_13180 [Ceratobasidium sp. AG-Ba]
MAAFHTEPITEQYYVTLFGVEYPESRPLPDNYVHPLMPTDESVHFPELLYWRDDAANAAIRPRFADLGYLYHPEERSNTPEPWLDWHVRQAINGAAYFGNELQLNDEEEGWDRPFDYSGWRRVDSEPNSDEPSPTTGWGNQVGWGPGSGTDHWEAEPVENDGWGPAPPAIPEDYVPAEIPDLSAFAEIKLEWEELERLDKEEWVWEGIQEGDMIRGRDPRSAFAEYMNNRDSTSEVDEPYVPER